jgi:hypothetical protein
MYIKKKPNYIPVKKKTNVYKQFFFLQKKNQKNNTP